MTEFKPGDVVQLKSGGPLMTVDYCNEDIDTICCSWFHGKARNQEQFHPETLQKRERPKVGITHLGK